MVTQLQTQYPHAIAVHRELELLEVTDDFAFVVFGPVACVIWRGEVDREAILGTERLGMRALEHSPEGAGLLFYPEGSAPDPELRELSTSINERLAARGAVGVAGVLIATGFTGIIQRGIATGMAMLSASSYPMKLFATTPRAVAWLGNRLRERGVGVDDQEVARVLGEFREAYLASGAAVMA